MFIELSLANNKKIVIGSIYCPGTKYPGLTFTEQFAQFSEILSTLLADISNEYEHVFIYGDFNLNILDLSNKFIAEYVETNFSYGFLQLITRPTRVSGNSATLLDHILTNPTLNCHDTFFIICSRLSDHFPVIHQFNFNKAKTKLKPLNPEIFPKKISTNLRTCYQITGGTMSLI